uniref:Uncharacterized protein n=1 Tax=Molossus molossus TaxID=27622 RepID=A0A7J8EFM7_MOLMO|nr:hypothetical protein HJG59_008941 [Molossus molossus]
MSPSILLTLLCLGIASAAPTTDHSSEAQPTQRTAAPGNVLDTVEDVINNVGAENSPIVLEKDNQEPIEEQKDFRAPCGDIKLRLKTSRGLFNAIKRITRKAKLGKTVKGFGKHILGKITRPDNILDIASIIGNEILGGSNAQPSEPENSEFSNMVSVA